MGENKIEAEGDFYLYPQEKIEGNQPHLRAEFKIGCTDHVASLWPSKRGNYFVGNYHPKGKRKKADANV